MKYLTPPAILIRHRSIGLFPLPVDGTWHFQKYEEVENRLDEWIASKPKLLFFEINYPNYGRMLENRFMGSQNTVWIQPSKSKVRGLKKVNTRIRQRSVMKFLFKSGDISDTVIHSNLPSVYRKEHLDRRATPTPVVTDQNLPLTEELIKNKRTMTTYQIMENFPCLKEVFLNLFLSWISKICSKWVPKPLALKITQIRKEIFLDFLETFSGEPSQMFEGVITWDETFIYEYDPSSER
ncbi:hypothetical protein LAZ67_14001638 [Cordylochernes scorpioides]|uniref:Transposase n=1 Tax=Cordylochernes scorpioides TaxID=51811 RepID=A0ABY6LB31_9ARAC|nr:hypothetical protein LAZ67_14001638 [Cordylochernes scorpioides]